MWCCSSLWSSLGLTPTLPTPPARALPLPQCGTGAGGGAGWAAVDRLVDVRLDPGRRARDEDAALGDRLLLLRHDAEVELADHLRLLRVVGLDGVAGVLDDRAGFAAEDRRALLVGIELHDAGRGVLLHRADEEVGRR